MQIIKYYDVIQMFAFIQANISQLKSQWEFELKLKQRKDKSALSFSMPLDETNFK